MPPPVLICLFDVGAIPYRTDGYRAHTQSDQRVEVINTAHVSVHILYMYIVGCEYVQANYNLQPWLGDLWTVPTIFSQPSNVRVESLIGIATFTNRERGIWKQLFIFICTIQCMKKLTRTPTNWMCLNLKSTALYGLPKNSWGRVGWEVWLERRFPLRGENVTTKMLEMWYFDVRSLWASIFIIYV